MVSVCMATYNGSKFIIRQISSILVQLKYDDELVISDDNSVDNTLELINSIHDKRIRIVTNKSKLGPVKNFENALRHARGNFIFFADQDDVWLPNKISTMSSYLVDYDLILSNCEVVDENLQTTIPSYFSHRNSKPGFIRNLYKNSYIGCCIAFRRDILSYILPFPNHIHMHDWWIGLSVEARGRVKFVPEPLIKYVRHSNNVSPTSEKTTNSFWTQFQNRKVLIWCIIKRFFM